MDNTVNKKLLMAVAFDADNGIYSVDIGSGSSVPETAFCMAVVIKCLIKDEWIEKSDEILDLVKKYLDDPQYAEVK
jgi:hypothetical protein